MIVIPCKQATFFDVDDTIVIWEATQEQLEERGVPITCRGSLIAIGDEERFAPEWTQLVLPHRVHIEQLKKHKLRGHTIIVWSAGGYDWAAAVVKAFNLENYVDLVISKPCWYYDDLTPDEFMGKRYYFKDKS